MKINEVMDDKDLNIDHYLKNFGSYHIMTGTAMSDGEYKWRFRSKPRDTFRPIHNSISKQSIDKFGINIRSLLFGTFNREVAEQYADNIQDVLGRVKIIYPKGNSYRLFSSRHEDMTLNLKLGESNVYSEIMLIFKRLSLGGMYHAFSKQIKSWFKDDIRDYEGTFEDFTEDFLTDIIKFINEIDDELKDRNIKIDMEKLEKEYRQTMRLIQDRYQKYISTVVEIDSDSKSITSYNEIMIYAPDGFIVSSKILGI